MRGRNRRRCCEWSFGLRVPDDAEPSCRASAAAARWWVTARFAYKGWGRRSRPTSLARRSWSTTLRAPGSARRGFRGRERPAPPRRSRPRGRQSRNPSRSRSAAAPRPIVAEKSRSVARPCATPASPPRERSAWTKCAAASDPHRLERAREVGGKRLRDLEGRADPAHLRDLDGSELAPGSRRAAGIARGHQALVCREPNPDPLAEAQPSAPRSPPTARRADPRTAPAHQAARPRPRRSRLHLRRP